MQTRTASLILVALGGCSASSFDEDVFPSVEHAMFDVDSQHPNDLAHVDVEVTFAAGSRAQHEIMLGAVDLIDPDGSVWSLPLGLALPAGFDPTFEPDDTQTVQLVNVNVTNSDLGAACSRTSEIRVELGYVDHAGTLTYGYAPAVLTCL